MDKNTIEGDNNKYFWVNVLIVGGFFLLTLVVVFVVSNLIFNPAKPTATPVSLPSPAPEVVSPDFGLNSSGSDLINIPINLPSEYSYKSRAEIFNIRKSNLNKVANRPNYAPNQEVFGQIEDGKPWISLNAANCYWQSGKGKTDGNSEESVFVNNPMALVMIEMSYYTLLYNPTCSQSSFLIPLSLNYSKSKSLFTIKYKVSEFQQYMPVDRRNQVYYSLNGVNARDMGLGWGYAYSLENVYFEPNSIISHSYPFGNFIHLGSSCGVSGGCNNGSPFQPEMNFAVKSLPAKMRLKLWKSQPSNTTSKADVNMDIILE